MSRFTLEWIESRLREQSTAQEDHQRSDLRRAAVSIILRSVDTRWQILFIKRAEHPLDPWSGHMALPGGRVEQDEVPLSAAMRETFEEIALNLKQLGRFLGALPPLETPRRSHETKLLISPFVFIVIDDVFPQANSEVDEIHWFEVDRLLSSEHQGTLPYHWEGRDIELPCFRIDGRVIWGLTHKMISDLFATLKWI